VTVRRSLRLPSVQLFKLVQLSNLMSSGLNSRLDIQLPWRPYSVSLIYKVSGLGKAKESVLFKPGRVNTYTLAYELHLGLKVLTLILSNTLVAKRAKETYIRHSYTLRQ
jgi:hypothetical protein